jgi:hypothetical protein
MGKRLATVQSSYIPWKGYFDLINTVDEFVLLDDVQYSHHTWRNRNRIKTKDGAQWLTVPVHTSGRFGEPIHAIEIADPDWRRRHWLTIVANYRRAPGFARYAPFFEDLYNQATDTHLSLVNYRFLRAIADLLGSPTKLAWSMDYQLPAGRNERLIELCTQAGATTYVSGPSAKAYLDLDLFQRAGIDVVLFDYEGYPVYDQLFPPFDHRVSIVDLILNVGADAPRYLLTF